MPQYQGLELLYPRKCPSCGNTGYITTQRWNGEIEDHCCKCGYSFNKYGANKQSDPEPDQNHIRNNNIAQLLAHCQNTPKIGTILIKRLQLSNELLEDCKAAGLLHQVHTDLFLTSSRGKRFLETRQLISNTTRKEASI